MGLFAMWVKSGTERGVRRRTSEGGFTLIELLVVLAILGLLVALATPQMLKYLGKAKSDAARIDIHNIEAALDLYRLEMRRSSRHHPEAPIGTALISSSVKRRSIPGGRPTSIGYRANTASTTSIRSAPITRPAAPARTRM
jgi:prepilin-type N-terminal cleavage/methylation domain-containing protein